MSVSAVVCVLLMFFFPLPQGNFQSTHGPVTALRSLRAFLLLVFSIMAAALQSLAVLISNTLLKSGHFLWSCTLQPPGCNLDRSCRTLRC